MCNVTFKGNPVKLKGLLPAVGSTAPDFTLTAADLADTTLESFKGKTKILSIVPSLDTPVCAASARAFNQKAGSKDGVVVLNISADLPFAASRFCTAEGLNNVVTLSTFRSPEFLDDYGIGIAEGPLAGLTARAVLVLNPENKVVHSHLVPEITDEPDYDSVLKAL
ncbi:MAG: thiol peroxidase [Acidobacteriota bacterium]